MNKYINERAGDLIAYGEHFAVERFVCARRARKLKRRGESVRYAHFTIKGKSRYVWLMRISPWALRA